MPFHKGMFGSDFLKNSWFHMYIYMYIIYIYIVDIYTTIIEYHNESHNSNSCKRHVVRDFESLSRVYVYMVIL